MFNGFCHFANAGSFGNFGAWRWLGMILSVIAWVGLLVGLIPLGVWALRRSRVPDATVLSTTGQPTAKEILPAQYACGEITRDQYKQMRDELS